MERRQESQRPLRVRKHCSGIAVLQRDALGISSFALINLSQASHSPEWSLQTYFVRYPGRAGGFPGLPSGISRFWTTRWWHNKPGRSGSPRPQCRSTCWPMGLDVWFSNRSHLIPREAMAPHGTTCFTSPTVATASQFHKRPRIVVCPTLIWVESR